METEEMFERGAIEHTAQSLSRCVGSQQSITYNTLRNVFIEP